MTARRIAVHGLVDQAMSSAGNVLLVLAMARTSDVAPFGVFALGYTSTVAGLAIARGLLGTPLLLGAAGSVEDRRAETGWSVSVATLLGATFGLVGGLILAALGEILLGAVLALASVALTIQDTLRHGLLAARRPQRALIWDGAWAAVSATLYALSLILPGRLSPVTALVVWGVTGAAISAAMMVEAGTAWRVAGLAQWWRGSSGSRIRFGLEAAIGSLGSLLVLSVAAALIGATATAGLRGAATVMGPLSLLMAALPVALIPSAVANTQTTERLWHRLELVAIGMSTVALCTGLAGWLLPESWGRVLLGPTWAVSREILPITGVEYAAIAWISVLYTLLKGQADSARLLVQRVVYAALSLTCTAVAALVWGTTSAVAAALALAAIASAFLLRHRLDLSRPLGGG